MIPKIIHFCWFGKNKYPNYVVNCINSWKKHCPDYEIKLWNEQNYDVNKNQFIAQAYKQKKWAFVSDYARLDIVNQYGGFYLDTDVELVKSLQELESLSCFFAADEGGINTGLGFGSSNSHAILIEMMKEYEQKEFIVNGIIDYSPCTVINTKVFTIRGYSVNKSIQIFDGIHVFPAEYFSPITGSNSSFNITENTIGIHLSSRSWERPVTRIKARLRLLLGIKAVSRLKFFLNK